MIDLEKLPEYQAFKKAVEKQLTADNYYVRENMPEVGKFTEYDKDGDCHTGTITHAQAEREGIENLLEDEAYFAEFLSMSEFSEVVIPLMRSLIKEALNG